MQQPGTLDVHALSHKAEAVASCRAMPTRCRIRVAIHLQGGALRARVQDVALQVDSNLQDGAGPRPQPRQRARQGREVGRPPSRVVLLRVRIMLFFRAVAGLGLRVQVPSCPVPGMPAGNAISSCAGCLEAVIGPLSTGKEQHCLRTPQQKLQERIMS